MRLSEITLRPLCKPPSKIRSIRADKKLSKPSAEEKSTSAPEVKDKHFSMMYGIMDDKTRAEIISTVKEAPVGTVISIDNFAGAMDYGNYGFVVRESPEDGKYLFSSHYPRGKSVPTRIPLADSDSWIQYFKGDYANIIYPKKSKT